MKTLLTTFIVLSFSLNSHATLQCSDLLKSPEVSRSLTTPRSNQLQDMSLSFLSENALTQLIQYEILHSSFFKQIIEQLNKSDTLDFGFDSTAQIAMLSKEQTDRLAHAAYNEIKKNLDNNTDLVSSLSDPKGSRRAFNNFHKAEVIDKIGESLIIIGNERDFYSTVRAIENRSEITGFEVAPLAIGGVGGLLNGLVWVMEFLSYRPENLIYNPTWQSFFAAEAALIAVPFLTHFLRGKLTPRWVLNNRIKAHATIEGTFVAEEHITYTPGDTAAALSLLSSRVDSAKEVESVDPTSKTLLTFGAESVALHKDLIAAFTTDFMRWMNFYDRNKDSLRTQITAFKDEASSQARSQETLSLLSKMFQEASEATIETSSLSTQVIDLIEKDIARVENVDFQNHPLLQRSSDLRLDSLRLSLMSHRQFLASLDPIHVTISNIFSSVESLGHVDTLTRVNMMTERANSSSAAVEQSAVLEAILKGFDEMDSYVEKMKAAGPELSEPQ